MAGFSVTIEGMAKSLGLFAAYFAVYEAYLGYFQPAGQEALEDELGDFYTWFFEQNNLGKVFAEAETTSDKAQCIAVVQLVGALATVFMSQKLLGLCILSWYYMSAARGHVFLKTKYVPVVLTMFGFTHVSLLTNLLSGLISSPEETPSSLEETLAADGAKSGSAEANPPPASTTSKATNKKKGNKKKKSN